MTCANSGGWGGDGGDVPQFSRGWGGSVGDFFTFSREELKVDVYTSPTFITSHTT